MLVALLANDDGGCDDDDNTVVIAAAVVLVVAAARMTKFVSWSSLKNGLVFVFILRLRFFSRQSTNLSFLSVLIIPNYFF